MALVLFVGIAALDALHICCLVYLCGGFIGPCRTHKKALLLACTVFWAFSCFLRLTPASLRFAGANAFLWLAEMPFVFAVSFFFSGNFARRLASTLLFPLLYWGGQWVVTKVLYGTAFVENKACLVTTAVSLALFAAQVLALCMVRKSRRQQKQEMLEQELRMYENQFDIIRQSQKNLHALRHDMKHHGKMLADMLRSGDNAAALQYLAAMGTFMENEKEYVSSGNPRIDGILNYMLAKAKGAGVDVTWKVQIPEGLSVSAFDINVVLSNLFENAFHALQTAEKPQLQFLLKYDKGVLYISLQNNGAVACPERKAPKSLLQEMMTEHGYGLQNMQRIAEKYHGSVSITCEQDTFSVCVLLFMPDVPQA